MLAVWRWLRFFFAVSFIAFLKSCLGLSISQDQVNELLVFTVAPLFAGTNWTMRTKYVINIPKIWNEQDRYSRVDGSVYCHWNIIVQNFNLMATRVAVVLYILTVNMLCLSITKNFNAVIPILVLLTLLMIMATWNITSELLFSMSKSCNISYIPCA